MDIGSIEEIVKDAGKIMVEAVRPRVMEKSGHANFCTETDEKIQAYLTKRLKEILPEASVLGEEDGKDVFTEKMSRGFCFVIDPIDGTSNFIYAYRPSVVSVGLLKDGKPYMAVIYNPYDDMLFSATKGEGAYMNGERIMSSDEPLADSLAVFGSAPYYTEFLDKTFDIARNLLPLCVDLRRSGTAAWDMCCVAMGRCSLYFEMKIQLWDYAAAALIADEAGCTVTDTEGNPLSYKGPSSVLCRARGVKEIPGCFQHKTEGLEGARKEIEEIDRQMAALFTRRMKCAESIADYKYRNSIPILDTGREKALIEKNEDHIKNEDIKGHYRRFFKGILDISKEYQKELIGKKEARP